MQTPSLTLQGDHVKMLWITDPWSTLDQSKDTTLRLMLEAINMGIPTYWSASDQLFSTTIPGHVMALDLSTHSKDLGSLDLSQSKLQPFPLSIFQQIHDRIDPPVDELYRKIIDQLIAHGAKKSQILNPPELLKNQSEKVPPLDLFEYTPRMQIIQNEIDIHLLEKLFSNDLEIVSKPLHLAQSIGVEKHPVPKNSSDWKHLISKLTNQYTQEILIEEFLPEINLGEVRMWFAGSQLIAALKKFPKSGDFRVLIDEGSRVAAYHLSDEEKIIAQKIGLSLQKQGILLAAVDLIGNKICDYNITSPGLLVQLEQVHGGKNFAKEILIQALQYPALKDHE